MKAVRYGKAGAAPGLRSAKRMEKHALGGKRASAITRLTGVRNKHALPIIKRLVFDFHRQVRKTAVEEMAKRVGWRKTIKFISDNFKSPGAVPAAFFYYKRAVGGRKRPRKWLERDWMAMEKQAVVDAREQKLRRMLGENGRPFSVNGIPVFLERLDRWKLGTYRNGVIVVQARTEILPADFRECIAWHEFGEIFWHDTGLAFQLDNLKKTGKIEKYLRSLPFLDRMELQEIEKNW